MPAPFRRLDGSGDVYPMGNYPVPTPHPTEAVHSHRSPEANVRTEVTWWLCAGVRWVPSSRWVREKQRSDGAFAVHMWSRGKLLCRNALSADGLCLGSRGAGVMPAVDH
jgi:hypothetical protein